MYLNIYMTCLRPEGEGRRIRAVTDNVGVALDPLAKDVAAPRQHVEHHAPHLSFCVYTRTHTCMHTSYAADRQDIWACYRRHSRRVIASTLGVLSQARGATAKISTALVHRCFSSSSGDRHPIVPACTYMFFFYEHVYIYI